ncbi:MAG: ComF family protein [Patescibacteria group bacterium]
MLSSIKNFFLDTILPPLCIVCEKHLVGDESARKVCDRCWNSVPTNDYLLCPTCFNRMPTIRICHPETPYLLAAATDYGHPVMRKVIHQFKYTGWQSLADPLGQLLIAFLKKQNDIRYRSDIGYRFEDWLVVPVPLARSRERERGFNQAELLAERVNREIGARWLKDNLVREKDTLPQAELKDWRGREENIRDAFGVVDSMKFADRNILLVDDVFTSGSTINEAARVLKLNGAKKIIALVVAKAR